MQPVVLLLVALAAVAAAGRHVWTDYYAVMAIPQSAKLPEIRKAFRTRALELHPDKNSAPDAESRFRVLVEAYETLGDSGLRASYDSSYANMRAAHGAGATPPPDTGSSHQTHGQPSPPAQGPRRGGSYPNYREFFKNFEENLQKHFEEHFKRHQEQFGLSDDHMAAHMANVAQAQALAAEHHTLHLTAMSRAHAHADAHQQRTLRGKGGEGKGDGGSSPTHYSRDAQNAATTEEHVTVKHSSQSCTTVKETTNGRTVERTVCTNSES